MVVLAERAVNERPRCSAALRSAIYAARRQPRSTTQTFVPAAANPEQRSLRRVRAGAPQ
jgi:hypothetical protein